MKRATKETTAGRRYLDLQREARRTGRLTDELIQLYALECFLDRLTHSNYAEEFVLKGGVLLAAFEARRPTRDIDLSADALDNDVASLLGIARDIAAMKLDDGLLFDPEDATAETIREEDGYSGVRITIGGTLSRAVVRMNVDVNVGDPIWPAPQKVRVPRLLGGALVVRGYPLEMVLAEKILTAIARGTANTRWRDFVDVYSLVRRHSIDGETFRKALLRVAEHRDVTLVSLKVVLSGYAAIAQQRWQAWLKKQRIESRIPSAFSDVLDVVVLFADPAIAGELTATAWDPVEQRWT